MICSSGSAARALPGTSAAPREHELLPVLLLQRREPSALGLRDAGDHLSARPEYPLQRRSSGGVGRAKAMAELGQETGREGVGADGFGEEA